MIKRIKEKLRITKRDLSLFQYLYENKIATIRQMERDIFTTGKRAVVTRRINKLIRAKLIKSVSLDGDLRLRRGYSLTELAFNRHVQNIYRKVERRQFGSNTPFHDLTLADIRYFLEKKKNVKNYITENILQSGSEYLDGRNVERFREHYPDAVLEVRAGEKWYFLCLEYEASGKSKERYEDFLNDYYYDKRVGGVLFITGKNAISEKLRRIEKEKFSLMTPKIYHCTLDEVLSGKNRLDFVSFKNTILEIS